MMPLRLLLLRYVFLIFFNACVCVDVVIKLTQKFVGLLNILVYDPCSTILGHNRGSCSA
jgi:hypothetical protein